MFFCIIFSIFLLGVISPYGIQSDEDITEDADRYYIGTIGDSFEQFLIYINVTLADSNRTTFSNNLSSENLTFTGNQNFTRNISIYRYADVTSAFINLTGYENVVNDCYQESANESNQTGIDGSCGLNYSGVYGTIDSCAFDGDWSDSCGDYRPLGNITYTPPRGVKNATLNLSVDLIASANSENITIPSDCIGDNLKLNFEFIDLGLNHYTNTTCFNISDDSKIPLDICLANDGTGCYLYEEAIYWNMSNHTNNPYISINNTDIWNHTGEFNSTFSPNKTSDFASTLNTALNSGDCDCNNCQLDGDNCIITLTFHSDSFGILKYSAIDIQLEQNASFNLSIGDYLVYNNSAINQTSELGTLDHKTYMNKILDGGLDNCNCTTCNKTGDSCTIPFYFNFTDNIENVFYNSDYDLYQQNAGGGGYTLIPDSDEGGEDKTQGGYGFDNEVVYVGTGNKSWSMEVIRGIQKYELYIPFGSSRELTINYENLGTDDRNIKQECENKEGTICNYVEFEEDSFTLQALKETKQVKKLKINLEEMQELNENEFIFNVKSTDELKNSGTISIFVSINPPFSFLGIISKFSPYSKTSFGLPYLLLFFPVFFFSLIIFAKILPKGTPIKAIWVFLISLFLAIIPLILL